MTAAFLCCRSGARPGSVMASLCRCFGPTAKAKWAGTGGGALPWPAVSRGAEPERPRESSLSEQRRVSRDRADRRVPEGEPTARSGVAPTGRANTCVPGRPTDPAGRGRRFASERRETRPVGGFCPREPASLGAPKPLSLPWRTGSKP